MSAAIPLVGAGISAYGSVQQGEMTSASLNIQADSLMQQAAEAERKGQFDAMRQQMMAGRKIGAAIAGYGASGVKATSGSVLDVINASHMNSELDRLNILHGADLKAINYQNQASMNRYGGASAKMGGYWRALGALTMGAAGTDMAGGSGYKKASGESAGIEEGYSGDDTGAAVAGIA